jgi:serine/threonine-protein kinase HipA
MNKLRCLRISLGTQEVGSLVERDDGHLDFSFDEARAPQSLRPVLSQSLQTGHDSLRGNGRGQLPAFFQNLLPEGALKRHLLERAGLTPNDEIGLLAYCGRDLPGDVRAGAETFQEEDFARPELRSSAPGLTSFPAPTAVAIAGVQPKLTLTRSADGRLTMRSGANDEHPFIGKLPVAAHEALPEVEHLSMRLAKAAGVATCEHELLPLSAITSPIPFVLRPAAEQFLLVHRFDRNAATPTGRLHMEDFAQATGAPSAGKYKGTYAAMGTVLLACSAKGAEDVYELLRRIKVNEMLGNFDAHLKNTSLLYASAGPVCLSPAYDIVAYSAYMGGRGHAMKFLPDQTKPLNLTPGVLRALANAWGLPEAPMRQVLAETVNLAMTRWPSMLADAPVPERLTSRIAFFLETNESVQAGRRRKGAIPAR